MKRKLFLPLVIGFLISANSATGMQTSGASGESDFTYSRGASIEESVLPSSPQAASASRYFSSDIAYSTGAAQVSVPIYTLAGHELSVPIGLRYSSGSGIKLDEVAGERTLEGVETESGRLSEHNSLLYFRDHLGSVRGVLDSENGQMLLTYDYAAYGQRSGTECVPSENMPDGVTIRRAFTGKESQKEDFDIDFIDFGARLYSPVIRRWVTPDPKSEDYYGISPYAYCAGDPVNFVDPDGRDLKDTIYGILIGVLTNTIAGSGAIRDAYSPTDTEDYNKSLKRTDQAFDALGTALVAVGGGMTAYGGIMATQGTVVTISTAGILSEVGVPVAVAGEGVVAAGAASSAVGLILQANSTSNQTSGYNRGESSSDTKYKSINQLQQEVKKGIAPKGIFRFDRSHGYRGAGSCAF